MNRKLIFLLGLFSSLAIYAQKQSTVEDIINNPGPFIEEKIVVEGTVKQFVPETSNSNAHYLLEGNYGGIIKVKTDVSEPVKNKKYRVVGTVYSDNGRPFIHERSKECLDCIHPPPPQPKDNTLLYVIIGASVLLIIIIVFFIIQNKRNKSSNFNASQNDLSSPSQPVSENPDSIYTFSSDDDDFKTIKFSSADSDPKTMKFVPGKLELISGEDKGKTFRIAGYPTSEGSVVTMGTKPISGDRSFAHILIDKKFKTVSRLHAELIYRNGILYVKNHSEVNPTQIDGIELSSGKLTELKKGSVMRTGELEFKYLV